MVVATGYELLKTLRPHPKPGEILEPPLHMNGQQWVVLAIGFIVSFIVALGVVAWFMSWVRRRGFAPFAVGMAAIKIPSIFALKVRSSTTKAEK